MEYHSYLGSLKQDGDKQTVTAPKRLSLCRTFMTLDLGVTGHPV